MVKATALQVDETGHAPAKPHIPSGYKQTEVGLIPEDWKVTTVGEEFSIQLGKMLDSEKNVGAPKPFLGNRSVQWGRIDLSDIGVIKLSPSDLQRFRLRNGDLLVCEGGEIGRAAIWQQQIPECYYQKALHRLRPKRAYNVTLMLNVLKRLATTGFLMNFVTQTSIAHLPKDKLETVPIPFPPSSAEQEAIAEALSDADALIESLEQLIAKKRQIKQGAMQELLTSKKRLPGFNDDWISKSMSELAGGDEYIVDGPFGSNLKNSDYVSKGVPVLQGLNITGDRFVWKDVRYISDRKARDLYRSNAQVGDLLTVKIGSVGFTALIDNLDGHRFAIIPANLLRVRVREGASDAVFLHYALASGAGKNALKELAANTAQPALSLTGFRRLPVSVPGDIEEQTAIAATLTEMDAEITTLESKLAKARMIEQGMMQDLLTGRIRLI